MDHMEFPNRAHWDERRRWLHEILDIDKTGGAYQVGEHALALLVELQAVFCAGAYVSTVVIACTLIDAHLREAELDDRFEGGIQAAFGTSKFKEDVEWLRRLRNAIVHFDWKRAGVLTLEDQWVRREEHEASARKAIELVGEVLFEHPWV